METTDLEPGSKPALEQMLAEFSEAGVEILEEEKVVPTLPELNLTEFGNLRPAHQRILRSMAQQSLEFLSGPLIADHFPSHPERRAWRQKMTEKYGDTFLKFYKNNRLRGNMFLGLWGNFEFMKGKFGNSKKALLFDELAASLPGLSTYEKGNYKENLVVVKKMEELARRFLGLVTAT